MIRQLDKSELPRAAEIICESFSTVAKEFGITKKNWPSHTSFSTTPERLQEYSDSGWIFYGLFTNIKLIGLFALHNKDDGIFKIHHLAVLPGFRHLGYGKQLLDFCKNKVKEYGGNKLELGLIEDNKVLIDWYIANRFKHIGTKRFETCPFAIGYMEFII
jgi:ribosomal protein S18 acetylase RimI-like enzyme